MKAGVVYPQLELGGNTGGLKAFAQAAEDLGYHHIVIYDHVLGAVHAGREPKLTGPYTCIPTLGSSSGHKKTTISAGVRCSAQDRAGDAKHAPSFRAYSGRTAEITYTQP
jgi:hypothetical protein